MTTHRVHEHELLQRLERVCEAAGFRLLKDGGEIIVVANDSTDKASIAEIEMHLGHIATMFSDGDFNAPMLIHDTNPPGVATMTRLKGQIHYEVAEIQQGAKIRITIIPLALKPPTRYTHSSCFKLSTTRQAIRQPSSLISWLYGVRV